MGHINIAYNPKTPNATDVVKSVQMLG